MKKIAQVISVVFHPLLMTTYLFLVLSVCLPSILQPLRPSAWLLFLVFLMTFLLPSLNFLFFRISGTISDLTLFNRKDRILPFAFITILYCVVTFMFYWKFPVPNVMKLMLIVTAMVILSAIITLFFKVSVHSVAVWGILGILLPLNNISENGVLIYPIITGILIAGIVMSSRLKLDAHEPREVLVGAVLGFVVGFGGMFLMF